jgi:hypothetical protein
MATVNKDFKVKNGLIVEGTTGTIDGHDILTKKTDDVSYIVDLIGGTATSDNTPDTVVKRDESGDFSAGNITANLTGDVTGNADTATTLETSRKIEITGDATGETMFDGSENVQISVTLDGSFATDTEVATAKSEAIADAASYTDGEISTLDASLKAYADDAEADAKAYTDTREIAITSAYEAYADQAELDAISAAEGYTDQAIANLVDSAPETLDTLNELAAALQDNPDIISDLQDIAAGKQDALTAGANIDITDDVISVTGLDAADISDFDSAAVSANTGLWDTIGDAAAAQTAAEGYADGLDSATNTRIDELTTDNVAEGTAQYFTDVRAKDSAGDLLANATKENVEISYVDGVLSITAENGVADSTTDDLEEGETNLYFTDSRAVTALEAVTPNFPAVEISSVAKNVAASAVVETASTNTAVSWSKEDYRSAEFLVKIANGTHTEVSKVILTLDTSDNIAITEYAMVGTNGSLGSVSADISGTDVRLRVVTDNNNSTVSVVGMLLV